MNSRKPLTQQVLELLRTQVVICSVTAFGVALKLDGSLDWSWLAVLAPLWGFVALGLLVLLVGAIIRAGRAAAK